MFGSDSTVFAGTGHGVFESVDRGVTWTPIGPDTHNVAVVAVSPGYGSDQTIFAGAGDGLFVTRDAGARWENVGVATFGPAASVQAVAVSPNFTRDGIVLASIQGRGLVRSTDGGATFAPVGDALIEDNQLLNNFSKPTAVPIVFSPNFASDQTVFGFSGTEVFKSTNAGETWANVELPRTLHDTDTSGGIGALRGRHLGEDHPRCSHRGGVELRARWAPCGSSVGGRGTSSRFASDVHSVCLSSLSRSWRADVATVSPADTRVRPHLVRTSDGVTILIEGHRRRQVRSPRLSNVLERVLGRPRSVPVEARGLLDAAWSSSPEVVLAPSTTADGLIAVVPDAAQVAVSGRAPRTWALEGGETASAARAGTSSPMPAPPRAMALSTALLRHAPSAQRICSSASHLLIGYIVVRIWPASLPATRRSQPRTKRECCGNCRCRRSPASPNCSASA